MYLVTPPHAALNVPALLADKVHGPLLSKQPRRGAARDEGKTASQSEAAQRIAEILSGAKDEETRSAIVSVRFRRYEDVVGTIGPGAGIVFLAECASRLARLLRPGDEQIPERKGRFAIILKPGSTLDDARALGARILAEAGAPVELGDLSIEPEIYIGIAPIDETAGGAHAILDNAAFANAQARYAGEGRPHVFHEQQRESAMERLRIESDLRRAMQNHELHLAYQPIVAMQQRHIVGFETLLRWTHPTRGPISPSLFIPIAEETGMISQIGWWVLENAARQLQNWRRDPALRSIYVSVNLSAKQLEQEDPAGRIAAVLSETHLPPEFLRIEVTESLLIGDDHRVDALRRIADLGVKLLLDDFGTGYSSLSYIERFPLSTIKIDRAFVSPLQQGQSARLLKTITDMAADLGLGTIAEGIETEGQRARLLELGCHTGQGFLFSKPRPHNEAASLVLAQ